MEPFISQTLCVAFNFAPKGWALCNGQLLPINQNQALFSLLGTYYGGDGRTTFGLPDLRGQVGISSGNGFILGQKGGEETHTLIMSEMPAHTHPMTATQTAASATALAGSVLGDTGGGPNIYTSGGAVRATMNAAAVSNQGGSQAHENRQPYVVMNWIIALQGIYPSRS